VALVLDELDRMTRIVDDLLLLAKAEAPDFLHLDTVDVAALTDELRTKLEGLPTRAWALDGRGRGVVVADRQRLTQALMQLAENAVKHTQPEDEVAVGSLVGGGEVRFWIRDEGTGIASAEQPDVFRRFSRGAASARGDGAGLGLSIVQAIAEAHHGRVELASEPGAGSTFTLVIPVDQPEGAPT
jgi:signal transduction histidine kinase